jgi:hypothetical protein
MPAERTIFDPHQRRVQENIHDYKVFNGRQPRKNEHFSSSCREDRGWSTDAGMWFVVADSLLDAIALVPDGYCVKAVDIQVAAVIGPSRVIGCFARPTVH